MKNSIALTIHRSSSAISVAFVRDSIDLHKHSQVENLTISLFLGFGGYFFPLFVAEKSVLFVKRLLN
jgi:hypothetical protein